MSDALPPYLTYVHGNTEYIITVFATEDQSSLETGTAKVQNS